MDRDTHLFIWGFNYYRYANKYFGYSFQGRVIKSKEHMMKKIFVLVLLSLIIYGCGSTINIPSQSKAPGQVSALNKSMLHDGIKANDKGDYPGAVKIYQEILKDNPDNIEALYELAYTYFTSKDYKKGLEGSLKGLEYQSNLECAFYSIAGNCLDELKRTEDAIYVYKKGINSCPDQYINYYNIALSYYRFGKKEDAEKYLISGIKVNPAHTSSLMLLGSIYMEQGKQIPSLLLFCRFLSLEPNTGRSETVLKGIDNIMGWGIEKKDSKNVSITISGFGKPDSPYSMLEMLLKLKQASIDAEENKNKSVVQFRAEVLESLISMINEIKERKQSDFTADYLFPYYISLRDSEFQKTFAYYIMQSSGKPEVKTWLAANSRKVEEFKAWNEAYKFNFK
jgi:tetratricopeptide (TPR) repeat protein